MNPIEPACDQVGLSSAVSRSRPADGAFVTVLESLGSRQSTPIRQADQADRVDPTFVQQLRQDDAHRRDKRQFRKGNDMLLLLSHLQRELLEGDDGTPSGRDTAALLETVLEPDVGAADATLGGIVQAIALRLKVELARRGPTNP